MPAISYDVTRTGDLSKTGSVNWALEGDVPDADLAQGQAKSGTLSWAANESAAKVVVVNTVGNTADNADRTCRIVLSSPVNATLGTASATTTILDDDASANTDYVPDLAFGGIMLGAAVVDGAIGNTPCRNADSLNAIVMYVEHDDPIVAISTENRIDHYPLGSTAGGYSDKVVVNTGSGNRPQKDGDAQSDIVAYPRGGDLRWRVAKVIGPAEGATGDIVLEKVPGGTAIRWVGETETIVACGKNASWQAEWEKSGGDGTVVPAFSGTRNGGGYPTIWFKNPIKLADWGLKVGDRIAICLSNLRTDDTGPGSTGNAMQAPYGNPPSHYMSVNTCHRLARPLRKSTYRYMAYSGLYWKNLTYSANNQRYVPSMLIGYRGADNVLHVKGNAYIGDSTPNIGFTRIRQIIYIPGDARWTGRRIIGFDAGVWRNTSSIAGNVTLTLSRATAGSVGNGTDNGSKLGDKVIAAANINVGGGRDGAADALANISMAAADFDAGIVDTVKAGEAYYLELLASNSGYTVGQMLNFIGRGAKGLLKADHQDLRNKFQTKSGTGNWTTVGGQTDPENYNILGVGLHLRAG